MSVRTVVFCIFAVLSAALFVRLGAWQLERLHERQARNAIVRQQQASAASPLQSLPRDTGNAHYRPASVQGRFDYDHELVATNRTRRGSPGVELLTPVRMTGSDTAVLVNRGWVYAPDGATVDRARWREGDSATLTGYVELYAPDAGVTASSSDPRIVRRVSRQEIASKVPYPVAPFYLVATGGPFSTTHPARREIPVLDDGPHRSYAVQWFFFAAIALGGAGAVAWRERRDRREARPTRHALRGDP
jgi:surfeit locus 1 family protein